MIPINKHIKKKNRGSVLIMAMILIVICSALAVSMATMSSANVQLASNQHHIDYALASAESGLEIQRCWYQK